MKHLLILILCMLTMNACTRSEPAYNQRLHAFSTLIDITLVNAERTNAAQSIDSIANDFKYMQKNWLAGSSKGDLAYTNEMIASQQPFNLPPSLRPLIAQSQQLANASDGLFNAAIGKVITAWGTFDDNIQCAKIPTEDRLSQLLTPLPTLNALDLDKEQICATNPNIQLNFDIFLKGYAIDHAIEKLKQSGIHNALINADGNIRAMGSRRGVPWRVVIRDPDGNSVFGSIEIDKDESVFTASKHDRSYQCEDQLIHPNIDPRNGKPATDTLSVTVIHPSAAIADASSSVLLIAGPTKWQQIAKQMGVNDVLLIDNDGRYHMTDSMKQRLTIIDNQIQTSHKDPQE